MDDNAWRPNYESFPRALHCEYEELLESVLLVQQVTFLFRFFLFDKDKLQEWKQPCLLIGLQYRMGICFWIEYFITPIRVNRYGMMRSFLSLILKLGGVWLDVLDAREYYIVPLSPFEQFYCILR